MPSRRGLQALTVLIAAALACPLAGAAAAAGAGGDLDEEALRLDQQVQVLKDEVLEFNREAQRAEDAVLFPAHSRLSIYVGVRVSGLLAREVTVSLDDGAPQTYTYEDRDAKALLGNQHLQRVLRANVEPGPHRIRVSFTGEWADADEDDEPVTDVYEGIFDKGKTEAELELLLARESRVAKPRLALRQWRSSKS